MKPIKYIPILLIAFLIGCNNIQQPTQPEQTVKSTQVEQISPEDLATIAFLTSVQINEILDNPNYSNIDKIRLIKEATSEWGCTNPNAVNYDEFAKYDDGSCIFTATPTNDE